MSILIRGMKMPENCDDCPFNYDLMECMAALNKIRLNYEKRPEECPLIETKERKKMSDWISVKDRLPEHHVPVLAVMADECLSGYVYVAQRIEDGFWSFQKGYGFVICTDEKIKWWMPMPESPKEE